MVDIELDENKRKAWDAASSHPEVTYRPKTRALWVFLGLLVVALIGVAGGGYRALQRDNIQLSQVPEAFKSVALLSGRLDAAETVMRAWAGSLKGLAERVGRLERMTNTNLRLARSYSDKLTEQLEERVQDEMDERSYVVDGRLARLESTQESARLRLAQLQEEVAKVRQELVAARQDMDRNLAGLQVQLTGSEREVGSLAQRFDQRRVEFEAAKRHTYELDPEISLRVTRTNVKFQRFDGRVSLLPEARTLWVSQQGVQQPVVFYRKRDGERCELVVTHVARNSVVGYLMLPAERSERNEKPVAKLTDVPPVTH